MRAETAGDNGFIVLKAAVPHDRGSVRSFDSAVRLARVDPGCRAGPARPPDRGVPGRSDIITSRADRSSRETTAVCRFHHGGTLDRIGASLAAARQGSGPRYRS
ncbi:hypothetical protein GCM10010270_22510 [Streptomyces violaceus]|nr:hypothetical protein GCM10010270_22510 [Streptomyces janthinus]